MTERIGIHSSEVTAAKVRVWFTLALVLALAVLPGCAHHYLIKLTNGDRMIAISKPKQKDGNYHYRDEGGVECVIPQNRVAKIETGAVEREPEKKASTSTPPKKSKHWYLLWLG
jgi:hypothetical protein